MSFAYHSSSNRHDNRDECDAFGVSIDTFDGFDEYVDRQGGILRRLRSCAHDFPALENEDDRLGLFDPVDESGELLGLVSHASVVHGEGQSLEVQDIRYPP